MLLPALVLCGHDAVECGLDSILAVHVDVAVKTYSHET